MYNVYEIWKGLILARETEFAILYVSPSQAAERVDHGDEVPKISWTLRTSALPIRRAKPTEYDF